MIIVCFRRRVAPAVRIAVPLVLFVLSMTTAATGAESPHSRQLKSREPEQHFFYQRRKSVETSPQYKVVAVTLANIDIIKWILNGFVTNSRREC